MTILLSIDTTNGTSVAVLKNGETLSSVHHESDVKHAELIGSSIRQVLHEANIKPIQLTAVAVAKGPGLFTGLRVGLAAAIIFAEALDKPLFAAVSLDAIALEVYQKENPDLPLLVHTDARRGEVYWALYSGLEHGVPKCSAGPAVGKFDAVVNELREEFGSLAVATGGATAVTIGKLVDLQLAAGLASKDSSALYLRAPDATLPKPHQPIGKRVSS